jgi:hypothetical protein
MTETTSAGWLDELVPPEHRAEGWQLVSDLEDHRKLLEPLLARAARVLERGEEISRQATALVGGLVPDHPFTNQAEDGIGYVVGEMSGSLSLNAMLHNMGIDPDNLPGAAGPDR